MSHSPAWSGLDQSESDVTLVHLPGTRRESLSSLEWPPSERVGCNSSPPTWYTAEQYHTEQVVEPDTRGVTSTGWMKPEPPPESGTRYTYSHRPGGA
ncbi:hypothetical protein RRG08_067392 [Elysia crispata]|uniref:Uncharacterized protein n=1 Tax=Elysia crispata TaxID=231223 RepID=A0AAE0Y9B2_9GAST|nr:hypothetical protein RRG08_067392 [Elysia crispata]